MLFNRLIAVLAALAVTPALGQGVALPDETISDDHREHFRRCRAAVLIELNAPKDGRTPLPVGIAEAMQEQFTFIMADTLFALPALSFDDGARRVEFAEQFVLDFSRTVGSDAAELRDVNERTGVLLSCQPMLWAATKERIEHLLEWRRKAMRIEKPTVDIVEPPRAEGSAATPQQ